MSIFREVINEWYVADTSRKIKSVFKSRMEKGLRCSGAVPYGYLSSKEEKSEWVIDEEAAAVVRRIFQMVMAGENAFSKMPYPMPMMRVVPISADYFDSTLGRQGFFMRQHYDFK